MKINNHISKIWDQYIKVWSFVVHNFPIIVFPFISIYYSAKLFQNLKDDTTGIINVSIGIAIALSGLSFAMSASSHSESDLKRRINFAGERFFHVAILLILAAVLKYTALDSSPNPTTTDTHILLKIIVLALNLLSGSLYMVAVLSAHTGIKVISEILWSRMANFKDWDDIV